MMVGWRRLSAAASLQMPPVTILLFVSVFSWGHATAYLDIANMTELQKHVSFFDRNKDGIITPSETFEGYVALGCDVAFSRESASSVHAALGPKTSPVDAPLPQINIYIDQIHKGMHGSDTGAYDANGRFVPQKFEEIFIKHAKVRSDALTSLEVEELILSNRDPLDPQSWGGPVKEWGLSYKLSSDKDGFLHKDSIRGIYDASEFVKLEEKRRSSRSEM
ncbi:probable peroxygenase 5 [Lolium perenne]|uniref:probable peroxygenase 5 n=1 Tax=Lolium perenne TaxID=4522 RepID=UPI0021F65FFA|nr:probable peroxygenase 5 [Lolium perenne]